MAKGAYTREQVLERVQKLLQLADSEKNPSEGEACMALQRAHELLEQYGLDMAEVHVEQGGGWDVIDWLDEPRSQYDTWNKTLGFAAANLFNCQSYTQSRHLNKTREWRYISLGFIGDRTDVAMAREVWPWLVKTCRKLARAYAGKGWNASHRTFAERFAVTVWVRTEEMCKEDELKQEAERTVVDADGKEKEICTALVVAEKKDAVKQWLEDQGIKFKQRNARSNTGAYDPAAGAAGAQAGREVNLDFRNQVGGGKDRKQIGS